MNPYRLALGFLVAFLIGAGARIFKIPVPAPPTFIGAFLIVTMTAGWIVTDHYMTIEEPKDVTTKETTAESLTGDSEN